MQSESKWKRELEGKYRNYHSTEEYQKDDTVGNLDGDSPIKKLLIYGALGAAGVFAYKKGAMKPLAKEIFEKADLYRTNSLNISPRIKAFKAWSEYDKGFHNIENSIFRKGGVKGLGKKLIDGNIKTSIRDTKKDLEILNKRVTSNIEKAKKNSILTNRNYYDSKFIRELDIIDDIHRQNLESGMSTMAAKKARRLRRTDLSAKHFLTEDMKNSQLRKSGYRSATLDDLIEYKTLPNGNKTMVMKRHDITLDKETSKKLDTFIRETRVPVKGVAKNAKAYDKMINTNTYKNIVLDPNIMVNEKGSKVIDLRFVKDNAKSAIHSLSNDYQIPLLGFNPLRFFGGDKFGVDDELNAIIHLDTIQPLLTGAKGKTSLRTTNEFGKNPLQFMDGKLFRFDDDGSVTKIAEGLKANHMPRHIDSAYGIRSELNAFRKMSGLKSQEYILYDKDDGMGKYMHSKISEFFDIGFQDKMVKTKNNKAHTALNDDDIDFNILNPASYLTALRSKADEILPTPYKALDGTKQTHIANIFGNLDKGQSVYVLTKQEKKFNEVLMGDVDLFEYFSQFYASRKNIENANSKALFVYSLSDRLNQTLSGIGLGLGLDNTSSAFDILKNLVTKRFLPAYAGYQGYQYMVHLTEDDEGNNIQKTAANGVRTVDMGFHKLKDVLGITKGAKWLKDLTPGSDHITELPGINFLGLDQTSDEREKYYEEGMTPIRSGRFWQLGNTPFTGKKISYFKPNWYRRTQADVEFSDSKYGSREEYFDNAWFMTPGHQYAPLKHFLFDKYHYEKKHYYDRPYLLSSPEFEGVPIIGETLSGTIGKVIKPQKKMHLEYWQEQQQEQDTKNKEKLAISKVESSEVASKNIEIASEKLQSSSQDFSYANPLFNKDISIYNENIERMKEEYEAYTTSSGKAKVVNVPDDKMQYINSTLNKMSIKKVEGATDMVRINEPNASTQSEQDIKMANGLAHTTASQYDDVMNLIGMTGFMNETFITGSVGDNMSVIDTSGYSMSFNKSFWDKEIGGIGGELSEIFRRFINKRRNDYEYVNPIRNTMPSYMPGENYFIDFKHGDPYSKVSWGEGRLPGEGYERLWNIKDPLDMGIGSSFIGKSVEDIKKHLLKQDSITDPVLQDIVDSGTRIHEQIERQMTKEGIAIDTEQKVFDKEHNIVGTYDVRMHDNTSKSGQAILDIKTISAKGFKEIQDNEQAKEEHQKQVNFYLNQLGIDKGYVMYVNRENTDERFTLQFDYDKKLYEESVGNVEIARNEIKQEINNRQLSRGDLYEPMDKFRILADVAPYSDEFRELKKQLSSTKLSEEEQQEYRDINDRVSEQKEPLRVYDYKFKTANIEKEEYEIDKVLDDDKFTVKGLDGVTVRLAGLKLNKKETEEEQEKVDKYLKKYIAPGKKITLGLDGDPNKRGGKGTYNSIDAVAYKDGKNLNRELIQKGYGVEKEGDNSATGIQARYSQGEILFGSIWERIAHADTYLNTKFLQVRSPYEMYERNEVYGEDFAEWSRPIKDFVIPTIRRNIEHPSGLIIGTIVGSMVGKRKYSKGIGGAIGFGITAIGKALVGGKEAITGEKWIPKERQKENEMDEYVDKLKYVKNIRLYEKYKRKAKKEDGFDVENYLEENEMKGEIRKNYKRGMNKSKTKYKREEIDMKELESERKEARLTKEQKKLLKENYKESRKELKEKIKDTSRYKDRKVRRTRKKALKEDLKELDESYDKRIVKAKMKNLNSKINEVETTRKVEVLPENALKAIEYYNAAESTVYGYDSGEPLQNLISAMPKKERDYFKHFVNAPEEERDKILAITPEYLKNAFRSVWGMSTTPKEPLADYFTKHQLPDTNWIGWDESINMDTVKVKMVKNEGMELNEFNIWDDDKREADAVGEIPIPDIDYRQNANEVKTKLFKIFKNSGYDDIKIDTVFGKGNNIIIDNKNLSNEKVEEQLKEYSLI